MNSRILLLAGAGALAIAALGACGPTEPRCGNRSVEAGETCDDGNTVDGDGCSATCKTEGATGGVCGDGTVEGAEQCDDGNTTGGDGCEADCTPTPGGNVCGDGTKAGAEQCDDGNTTGGDGCEADCTLPAAVCGNSVREGAEQCDDGNMTSGDGCENDCTSTQTTVETCPNAPQPPAMGTCEITTGDANKLFVGTVLAPNKVFVGGQVLVDGAGAIACVGCDCSGTTGAATATKVSCGNGIISPALINSHDHITFTADPWVPNTDERYEHRHDWRRGNDGHSVVTSGGTGNTDEITWSELRQVMSGTVMVAGSGGSKGLLRNIDRPNTSATSSSQEGLGAPQAEYETFPLGDSSGTELTSSCNYNTLSDTNNNTPFIPADAAWLPHIAEGIEASARNEMLCMTGVGTGAQSLVNDRTGIIHGIGVKAPDLARIASLGAKLIWSPRSNISLYGDTAPVGAYKKFNIPIALGTDWVRSGSMNILRELRCADYLNSTHYANVLTQHELWLAVTLNAARATGADAKTGSLEVGKVADIAIYAGNPEQPYRSVIDADPEDVVLTVRGGKVLYGDEPLVQALSTDACDGIDVCGVQKRACLQSEIGKGLAALQTANATSYPLFFCNMAPQDEPTCVPSRAQAWAVNSSTAYTGTAGAGDQDGDGIPDGMDNCPSVFNPVRPLDNGAQADNDTDGLGDVCDACPLDANTTQCSPIQPNDADADGVADSMDNCPADANPLQEDGDNDGTGNACDFCAASNPNNSACPVTIYEVKTPDGTGAYFYDGQPVSISGAIVTGRATGGFFMQVPTTTPNYPGPDYSGIFVFAPQNGVTVGDIVDVSARVQNFFGQVQLSNVQSVTVVSQGNALPAPVVALPAELADPAMKGTKLESVLVEIQNVTVTDLNPAVGPGDSAPTNEFVVDGALRVNDYLYLVTPFPALNESFSSIVGVLEWRNGNFKVEPRSASDFVGGTPIITSFGPALSCAREGQSGATFPDPLVVTISRPQTTATVVNVTSATGDLTVDNGGVVTIAAGSLSAPVPVTGVTQAASVQLTATLNSSTMTADVRVLGATEAPTTVTLTPASTTVQPGASTNLTVGLDIPAPPNGTTVSIALSNTTGFTAPTTVTIAQDQVSATVAIAADLTAMGSTTVTATLGMSSAQATVAAVNGRVGLVINELDYDQINTDGAEFIELYNSSSAAVSLSGISVVLVNGNGNALYKEYDLTSLGSLAPGQYLVIGMASVLANVPSTALTMAADTAVSIQNGAPDAVALVDRTNKVLVDSLSYEDGTGMTLALDGANYNLREGGSTAALADSNAADGSLARTPNALDTDNNATDFVFATTVTPGAAN